jgi:CubicO group peptidase (beta-lactamase class C family)
VNRLPGKLPQLRLLDGGFDGPSRGPERFTQRIEEGGTYRIEVAPIKKASGDWEIEILRLEPLETEPDKLTDQLMSPYAGDDTPGAAVQVWRDGETLFSKSYGMANLTWGIPFRTNTRTNIGSTSKQFTAFAIMLLVDRGELSLDDDIRDYIPELPEFERVPGQRPHTRRTFRACGESGVERVHEVNEDHIARSPMSERP